MFESSAVELLKHSKAAYVLTLNTPVKAKKAIAINRINNSASIAALKLCGDNINRKGAVAKAKESRAAAQNACKLLKCRKLF